MSRMKIGRIVNTMLLVGAVVVAQDNPFEVAAKEAYSGIYDGKDKEGAAYTLVLCERGDAFDGTVSRSGNVMQLEGTLDGATLAGEMKDANGASPIKVVVSGDTATFIAGSLKVELTRRDGPSFVNQFSSEHIKLVLTDGENGNLSGNLKFQGRMYDVKAKSNGALCWGTFAGGERSWRFTVQRESSEDVIFRTSTFSQTLKDGQELERKHQAEERDRQTQAEIATMQKRQEQERKNERSRYARRRAAKKAAEIRRAALSGSARAQNSLGGCYESGDGVREDLLEARRWYLLSARQGFSQAQYNLGLLYRYGRGVDRDDAEALQWFRKAAEKGHAKAQLHVGHAYRFARGVDRNDTVAIRWYAQSAKQKEPRAEYAIGKMFEEGNGVDRDYRKALTWYRKAAARGYDEAEEKVEKRDEFVRALPLAKEGDPVAQAQIGDAYTNGDGVALDYTKALEWYLRAADKQNAVAECGLGDAYSYGRGVPRDRPEAARWYRRAAERGYVRAQVSLGHCYRRGAGVDKDFVQAVAWYRKAVEQQDARAQHHLGRMYEEGHGVPQDYEEALSWFRKAADGGYASAKRTMRERDSFLAAKAEAMGGDAMAQRKVGVDYAEGSGVGKDSKEAARWFHRAARQDDAEAQYRLADCYCRGVGVEQDEKQAAEWCRKAAEKGDPKAQHLLGVLMHVGRGLPRDDKQAVLWFQKAAKQGNRDAWHELGVCYEMGYGVAQDPDAAVVWYSRLIAGQGVDGDLNGWLARARVWDKQSKSGELMDSIDSLIKNSPDSPVAYWFRGLAHEREGQLDEAIWAYTKALELMPDYAKPHARRAAIWEGQKVSQKAIDAYTLALQHDPGWATGYILRGLVWARSGDMEKVRADCARALELDPKDPIVLNQLAWIYVTQPALKNPAEAVALAKKAVELTDDESRPSVLDTLACAYAANGQFDEAARTERAAIAGMTGDLWDLAELQLRLEAFKNAKEPANLNSFEGLKPPAW